MSIGGLHDDVTLV